MFGASCGRLIGTNWKRPALGTSKNLGGMNLGRTPPLPTPNGRPPGRRDLGRGGKEAENDEDAHYPG